MAPFQFPPPSTMFPITVFTSIIIIIISWCLSLSPRRILVKERRKCRRLRRKQDSGEDIDNKSFFLSLALL